MAPIFFLRPGPQLNPPLPICKHFLRSHPRETRDRRQRDIVESPCTREPEDSLSIARNKWGNIGVPSLMIRRPVFTAEASYTTPRRAYGFQSISEAIRSSYIRDKLKQDREILTPRMHQGAKGTCKYYSWSYAAEIRCSCYD